MGKAILMSGGTNGDSSDDCTAASDKVLEGFSAITADSDDVIISGTMKNLSKRATIKHSADNNTPVLTTDAKYFSDNTDGVRRLQLRYNNTDGYITGNTLFGFPAQTKTITPTTTQQTITPDAGKVLESVIVPSIGGNANSNHVLSGYKFGSDTAGRNSTGTIPLMSGQTITPSTVQQTLSSSGKYMTGNVIVPAFSLPPAAAIKKGYSYTLYGKTVTGTWDGFVAGAPDIYNQGTLGAYGNFSPLPYIINGQDNTSGTASWLWGAQPIISYETGAVRFSGIYTGFKISNAINLAAFNTLNITWKGTNGNSSAIESDTLSVYICYSNPRSYKYMTTTTGVIEYRKNVTIHGTSQSTVSIDISTIPANRYIVVSGMTSSSGAAQKYIYRMWFS